MAKALYRVIARTTGSVQPRGTYWQREVLYCGYDRLEAVRVYHGSEPEDYGGGYGNRARETLFEAGDIEEEGDEAPEELEPCDPPG